MATGQQFLREAYAYAREAGLTDREARVAVAQAALETGYGKSVKGNNYLGIKAGKSYTGETQRFRTWEEEGGKRKDRTDKFRKYSSPVEAFKDWKRVVARKWPEVLTAKTFKDAVAALKAGKPGGYATDSKYGSKLAHIDNLITRAGADQYRPLPNEVPVPQARPSNTPYDVLARGLGDAGVTGLAGRQAVIPAPPLNPAPRGSVRRSPLNDLPRQPPGFSPRSGQSASQLVADASRLSKPTGGTAEAMYRESQAFGNKQPATASVPSRMFSREVTRVPVYEDLAPKARTVAARTVPPTLSPQLALSQPSAPSPLNEAMAEKQAMMKAAATPPNQMVSPEVAYAAPPVPAAPPAPPPVPPMPVQPPLNPLQMAVDSAPYRAPAPPAATPYDVYAGRADTAMSSSGNRVSGDQYGNTQVENQYGARTVTLPSGNQSFGSIIPGPLGEGQSAGLSLGERFPKAKGLMGAGVGSVVGGLLGGPGIIGALLGRELMKPGGGRIGDLINGVKTVDTSRVSVPGIGATTQFAKRDKSLNQFPSTPAGGYRDNSTFTNRSFADMSRISPDAARNISRGLGGLY